MKAVGITGLVVASALLMFCLNMTVAAAGRLMSPPRIMTGAAELGRSLRGVVVRDAEGRTEIDLGTLGRALLLVFDPECTPCNANMANWIDILAETRGHDISVVAVSLDRGDRAIRRNYWGPFGNRIPVFLADSVSIVAAGVRATPTTIVIDHERVAAEFVGVLNRREKEHLIDIMRRNNDTGSPPT